MTDGQSQGGARDRARWVVYSVGCDAVGCGRRIEDRSDAWQVIAPNAGSPVGADTYCSANCAKRALIREDDTDDRA
jgi:hypothetical protein